MRAIIDRAIAVLLVATALAQSGVAQSRAVRKASDARTAVVRGDMTQATRLYSEVLRDSVQLSDSLHAAAHFGRAYTAQQALGGNLTSASTESIAQIVQDYLEARDRLPRVYYGPASNNAGLVFVTRHRYREALRLFLEAAAGPDSAGYRNDPGPHRSAYYFNAARAYDSLMLPDSATLALRRAVAADSTNLVARRALLAHATAQGPDSVIAVVRQSGSGSADPTADIDALLSILADVRVRDSALLDSTLLLLGRQNAATRLSPAALQLREDSMLDRAEAQRRTSPPGVGRGIAGLRAVYRPDDSPAVFAARAGAEWWTRDPEHGRVWSRLLRSVGEWYDGVDQESVAIVYYETAVGGSDRLDRLPAWVDLEAVRLLGVKYVNRSDQQDRLAALVARVTATPRESLETDQLVRLRNVFRSVGVRLAARGRCEADLKGKVSAIDQLELMRRVTSELRARPNLGATIDPPWVLENLAACYQKAGRTDEAARVVKEVKALYERQSRYDESRQVDQRAGQWQPPR